MLKIGRELYDIKFSEIELVYDGQHIYWAIKIKPDSDILIDLFNLKFDLLTDVSQLSQKSFINIEKPFRHRILINKNIHSFGMLSIYFGEYNKVDNKITVRLHAKIIDIDSEHNGKFIECNTIVEYKGINKII